MSIGINIAGGTLGMPALKRRVFFSFGMASAVILLLVAPSSPTFGQDPVDNADVAPRSATQGGDKWKGVDELIVSVIESSKSAPMTEEQLHQAIDILSQHIAKSPNDVKLLVARAAGRVRLREMEEANKDLIVALKRAPNDGRAWYVFALMKIDATSPEFDRESVKEGIAALKKAHDLGYADPKLYAFLGAAHYRLGDKRRAVNAYTKAIEGNIKEAYSWRGDVHAFTGEPQLAIADYGKAIELGFTEPRIFFQRASMYYEVRSYREAISDFTRAITAMPDLPGGYYGRAQCYIATDEWNAAINDFDRAVEIEPSCTLISERGCAYIRHKDYTKGVADIRKAIQLNRGDLGVTYQRNTDKKLSSEALAHGEQQIRQMLKDRPAMGTHVAPGDKLWTWAVRKFAGEDLGVPIDWDPTTPAMVFSANVPSDGKSHGRIQIAPRGTTASDTRPTFEELWKSAVFELYNVAASPEFIKLDWEARQGNVTCDEYVTSCIKTEEFAVQRTRAFYVTSFLVWLPKSVVENTNPWIWGCTLFPSESGSIPLADGDARARIYAAYFNHNRAANEYLQGNYAKSKQYLQEVLPNEAYISTEHRRQARLMSGQIRVLEKDYAGAIADATAVLGIYPDNEHALHLRGNALALQGKLDEALVDYNHALRIKPDYPEVPDLRAIAFMNRKDDKAALADLDRAIRLQPHAGKTWSRRASLLLTSSDPAIRNPAKALNEAKQGCELTKWKSAYSLSVLASAYATLSDFDNAVKWQEKALSLCDPNDKESYAKTLESYKQKQSGRESARPQESGVKVMWVERLRLVA